MEDSRIGYHPSSKGLRNNRAIGERANRPTQNIEISRPDEIHPKLLFELRDFLSQFLTNIFNKSWDKTKLPKDWKLAHIASIFKMGKKSLADVCRPVNITSIVCKIFEKIIRAHLMEHLEKNEILVKEQFGFLHGKSSQLQLLRVLDDFTKTMISCRETDVIYLDFKKAFDSAPHKRLIGILKEYGIKVKTLGLINEFLIARRQRVVINDSRSEWKDVEWASFKAKLYLFADDAKLYIEITSKKDVDLLQDDLRKLEEWSKNSLLHFNEDNCVHMIISNGRRSYELYDKQLETIKEKKTWSDHP